MNDNGTALVPAQPAGYGPPSVPLSARLPEIAKALSQARKLVKPVPKTAYNAFLKAYYAPAEAVIEEATNALREVGLSLVPYKSVVNGHSKEGPDRLELESTFLLMHEATGEFMPVYIAWPISQEKGTTLLKATAATDTYGLAYYLRKLLAIARVDAADDPMASPPPPAETAQPTPAATPAPSPQAAAQVSVEDLAREHRRTPEDLDRMKAAAGACLLDAAGKNARLRQLVIQGLASSVHVDRIMELAGRLGTPAESLRARLRDKYHVDSLAHLTHPEAEEVEGAFRKAVEAKEKAAPAAPKT